jgi:hypothetical protein
MTRVAGVSENFMGFPLVLDGRKLGPSDVLAVRTILCSALRSDAEQLPYFEVLGTHAKSFQSSEGGKVLSCPLHDCLGVFGP